MKILVTVKQVPDTSGKVAVNPDGTLDRASMQTIINPDDLNAVEAALALKDELGCKVVAFTMGPPPAEGMLRELMAMGVQLVLDVLIQGVVVRRPVEFIVKVCKFVVCHLIRRPRPQTLPLWLC